MPRPFTADPLGSALRAAALQALSESPRFGPPPKLDLAGSGPLRFIAPHPASLIQLMLAVAARLKSHLE